jgi:hypothetical protein
MLRAVRAIKGPVLDRLRNVLGLNCGDREIRDGASDLQDGAVGARAEALLGHGALEQTLAVGTLSSQNVRTWLDAI